MFKAPKSPVPVGSSAPMPCGSRAAESSGSFTNGDQNVRDPRVDLEDDFGDPIWKYRTADGVAYYAHPRCRKHRDALGDVRQSFQFVS